MLALFRKLKEGPVLDRSIVFVIAHWQRVLLVHVKHRVVFCRHVHVAAFVAVVVTVVLLLLQARQNPSNHLRRESRLVARSPRVSTERMPRRKTTLRRSPSRCPPSFLFAPPPETGDRRPTTETTSSRAPCIILHISQRPHSYVTSSRCSGSKSYFLFFFFDPEEEEAPEPVRKPRPQPEADESPNRACFGLIPEEDDIELEEGFFFDAGRGPANLASWSSRYLRFARAAASESASNSAASDARRSFLARRSFFGSKAPAITVPSCACGETGSVFL
mmetsp:Transcript_25769/g.102893  ORF Transcript_25769/g.102893 Transcript_25769/m.102893 type:complete len:276 (-) Transcript_25769:838-1665(-)